MKKLLIVFLLLLSFSLVAGDSIQDPDLAYHFAYMQTEYKLVDPQGDYSLSKITYTLPRKIFNVVFNRSEKNQKLFDQVREGVNKYKKEIYGIFDDSFLMIYEDEVEKVFVGSLNDNLLIEGTQNPIKPENFPKMLLQVIIEENQKGIIPKVGEIHKWSKEFKKNVKWMFPILAYSKLLVALSSGKTFRFLKTGTEYSLRAWIVSKEGKSITISEMFRRSYRLNNGDVYLALLTIENLLAYHWQVKDRDKLYVTTRLKPFIHAYKKNSDNYGSWYTGVI